MKSVKSILFYSLLLGMLVSLLGVHCCCGSSYKGCWDVKAYRPDTGDISSLFMVLSQRCDNVVGVLFASDGTTKLADVYGTASERGCGDEITLTMDFGEINGKRTSTVCTLEGVGKGCGRVQEKPCQEIKGNATCVFINARGQQVDDWILNIDAERADTDARCPQGPVDTDGDGVPDEKDNCPNDGNSNQSDKDKDGKGDVCDPCPEDPNDQCNVDTDKDGIPDKSDNCPDVSNPDQKDTDKDQFGDLCDNCPSIANSDQADKDGDKLGNACDNCWEIANKDQLDSDKNCPPPPYTTDPRCGDACQAQ